MTSRKSTPIKKRQGQEPHRKGGGVVKTSADVASVSPHELDGVRLISARQTRVMLGGISDMQLWRYVHNADLGFPQPIKLAEPAGKRPRIISTRNFFRYREIVRWIAKREALSKQQAA
jgi:predicted DNA-binding transcriptional regulator AlpA